jgi:ATP-binding cassette subfamily G (WHITE) protein 2 (PDR)
MSARSVLACWDNSTRGLDASTALEFAQTLRLTTNLVQDCAVVAIYQAGEKVYEGNYNCPLPLLTMQVFDKVTVLYEGHQIFFGPAETAKQFFIDQGWECMERQTTADFLTAVTDPTARFPRPGFENRVPKTPADFARYWQNSEARKDLLREIDEHERKYPKSKEALEDFEEVAKMRKSKHMPKKSPYTVTIWMQIGACVVRAYQRMWGDKSTLGATIISNLIMSLVIGSVFYNTPQTTSGFFSKVIIL